MDKNLRIADLLKRNTDYQWINPECSVREMPEKLAKEGIHALLVGNEKELLGIITHIDVVKACCSKSWDNQKARDVMTSPVITVDISTPIERLKKTFEETKFVIIPIVSNAGEILGVVSLHDFFKRLKINHQGGESREKSKR